MAKKYFFIDTPGGRIKADAGPAGGGGEVHVILPVDVEINDNTTLQDVTGLRFTAAANTAYRFVMYAVVVTSANGTGYKLGLTGPASPTFWSVEARLGNGTGGGSQPGMGNSLIGYGEIGSNANGSVVGTNCIAAGVFHCGATGGDVQFQTQVEPGGTGGVIFKAGSRIVYTPTAAS
jgi:hypothetical protein